MVFCNFLFPCMYVIILFCFFPLKTRSFQFWKSAPSSPSHIPWSFGVGVWCTILLLWMFTYWISWMNSVESEFFSLYIPLSIFSQLVSWSANLLDRDFLECIEPINLPDFVERFVYVWEEYFNTPIDHLKHYFSHHFLLVQRLKVISGWEIRAFSISFLSMCTFRHMLHMAF